MASIFGQTLANERIPCKAKLEKALPLQIPSLLNESQRRFPHESRRKSFFSFIIEKSLFYTKENLSIQKESIFYKGGATRAIRRRYKASIGTPEDGQAMESRSIQKTATKPRHSLQQHCKDYQKNQFDFLFAKQAFLV